MLSERPESGTFPAQSHNTSPSQRPSPRGVCSAYAIPRASSRAHFGETQSHAPARTCEKVVLL
eukprot:408609-Prymnesium_polylepis.1